MDRSMMARNNRQIRECLVAQTQALNQAAITIKILGLKVSQEIPACADHLQETTS